MEWTREAPTQPGWYRLRMLTDQRDDGIREVRPALAGNRPVLVATWMGAWHNVEDFRREWLGPFDSAQAASGE